MTSRFASQLSAIPPVDPPSKSPLTTSSVSPPHTPDASHLSFSVPVLPSSHAVLADLNVQLALQHDVDVPFAAPSSQSSPESLVPLPHGPPAHTPPPSHWSFPVVASPSSQAVLDGWNVQVAVQHEIDVPFALPSSQ